VDLDGIEFLKKNNKHRQADVKLKATKKQILIFNQFYNRVKNYVKKFSGSSCAWMDGAHLIDLE